MTLPQNLSHFEGKPIPVLDDGHIMLIDVFGNDQTIVDAARVSYGKGTTRGSEDRHLIRYLMRHRHTSPFEMCEILIRVRCPIFVFRQWIRHRTANVNEYSGRYSEMIDGMVATKPDEWRLQSNTNKQGSGNIIDPSLGVLLSKLENEASEKSREIYQYLLDHGVAREQARMVIPVSNYTEAYWKIDLHNLFHFLSLRMDSHAQLEIRQYANAIAEIVKEWVPNAYEAFEDYRLNGMTLTKFDIAGVKALLKPLALTDPKPFSQLIENATINAGLNPKSREGAELAAKLEKLMGV